MRPVLAQDVERLHQTKEILLLNWSAVFLGELRDNPKRIQTKPFLPPEIWACILAVSDIDDIIAPRFVPITIESYEISERGTIRAEYLERTLSDSEVDSASAILRFEDLLVKSFPPSSSLPNAQKLNIMIPATYSVQALAAREQGDELSARVQLFCEVRFVDCHARLWEPFTPCRVCRGERFICPGSTGGTAQKYDAFISCGPDVKLSCPHCMGLDICKMDKDFNSRHYWEPVSDDDEASRREMLRVRLHQLGLHTNHAWVYQAPDGARKREAEEERVRREAELDAYPVRSIPGYGDPQRRLPRHMQKRRFY